MTVMMLCFSYLLAIMTCLSRNQLRLALKSIQWLSDELWVETLPMSEDANSTVLFASSWIASIHPSSSRAQEEHLGSPLLCYNLLSLILAARGSIPPKRPHSQNVVCMADVDF